MIEPSRTLPRHRRLPLAVAAGAAVLVVALLVVVALAGVTHPWTGSAPGDVLPGAGTAAGAEARPGGSGAVLRQVDGGPEYYRRFADPLPTDPSFFPIGVWLEAAFVPEEIAFDQETGLNTYVDLTEYSDLAQIRAAGMYALHGGPLGGLTGEGAETVGRVLADEVDMWAGAGDAEWTGHDSGQICRPERAACGFTVLRTIGDRLPADGRLRYANYGKAVLFWLPDDEAARFVNEFPDVVSADAYWFTDSDICDGTEGGQLLGAPADVGWGAFRAPPEVCHRAANYGLVVDRMRSLVSPPGSKPVWAFVELGHPSAEESFPSIRPDEIEAAVWSSLIHGARGIVYFNHSFGGPCFSNHVLREPCYADVRATVQRLNARIARLAPVLNAPFADHAVTVNGAADVAVKWHGGHLYLVAGSTRAQRQEVTFAAPCVGDATVTVLDEGRRIDLRHGSFVDTFDGANSVHIYRVDGGSSCGLY